MFLALNEMRHSKLRYALVVGVTFLIAYLVFFLTGLSYGLAQEYQQAINKWQATDILLSDKANDSLSMSQINPKILDQVTANKKAVLAQTPGIIIDSKDDQKKQNVSFFGIDAGQFLRPNIIEGKLFQTRGDVVADKSLETRYGYQLGDKVRLATNDQTLTILGLTDQAKFSVAPVLYTSLETFQLIRNGASMAGQQAASVNAIVTKGTAGETAGLKNLSIGAFIYKLPGYSAQVMTFSFMIGFLVVIAAIVIGIFIYVLTMQKMAIFGVMKAQGISSGYIARSVVAQTFVLAFTGVLAGLVATVLSALALPDAVPFQTQPLFFAGIAVLIVVVAILGALFSVRSIVKLDPLRAIG